LVTLAHGHNLLLDVNFWELVSTKEPVPLTVISTLLLFSLASVTIILAKWKQLRGAEGWNGQFLRAFRKAGRMDAIAAAVEQFRTAPLATVFEFGYEELTRQTSQRGTIRNPLAIERSLQIGISEEVGRLESGMIWLATTATGDSVHRPVRHGVGHYRRVSGAGTDRVDQHADSGAGIAHAW
jgi:biopolymer transport protein TolQ